MDNDMEATLAALKKAGVDTTNVLDRATMLKKEIGVDPLALLNDNGKAQRAFDAAAKLGQLLMQATVEAQKIAKNNEQLEEFNRHIIAARCAIS